MKGRRFGHFEVFKVVLTVLYLASGLLMFGTLISNASQTFTGQENRVEINCMNCDEVD